MTELSNAQQQGGQNELIGTDRVSIRYENLKDFYRELADFMLQSSKEEQHLKAPRQLAELLTAAHLPPNQFVQDVQKLHDALEVRLKEIKEGYFSGLETHVVHAFVGDRVHKAVSGLLLTRKAIDAEEALQCLRGQTSATEIQQGSSSFRTTLFGIDSHFDQLKYFYDNELDYPSNRPEHLNAGKAAELFVYIVESIRCIKSAHTAIQSKPENPFSDLLSRLKKDLWQIPSQWGFNPISEGFDTEMIKWLSALTNPNNRDANGNLEKTNEPLWTLTENISDCLARPLGHYSQMLASEVTRRHTDKLATSVNDLRFLLDHAARAAITSQLWSFYF
jgi:hypothetical protein